MARIWDFSPASKTVPANGTTTVIWTPAEIDSAGLVFCHLILRQSAGTFDLNDLVRIRIKANGQTVLDLSTDQIRSLQERFSPKGVSDALTGRVLTIPLNWMDAAGGDDAQDAVQFMAGAGATVEAVFTTDATGAGTVYLAWTKTNVAPQYYLVATASPMNVGASQNNAIVQFGAPGFVQALMVTPAAIGQLRVVLSGVQTLNLPGPVYSGLTNMGDALQSIQSLYDGSDAAVATTTSQWIKMAQGLQANPANSQLWVTSGSGMTSTVEYGILSLVPQNVAQAA